METWYQGKDPYGFPEVRTVKCDSPVPAEHIMRLYRKHQEAIVLLCEIKNQYYDDYVFKKHFEDRITEICND